MAENHSRICVPVGFHDEIDVMRSLAKPRKITIQGSNGQVYMFLGKPKDDLRKDARLMDFNAIINKLLKANSESRRRQLRTWIMTLTQPPAWQMKTRHPYIRSGYSERRVRFYSMGSKHDSDQASITQILRIKPNQKLGEFSKQNDTHNVDLQ